MNFVEGNGVLGRIRFTDGAMPEYDRPYLVVSVFDDYIEVLNVSSIKGKEYKLAFKTSERLRSYNPPFLVPSFVKLDSLTKVMKKDWKNLKILNNGRILDENELNRIKEKEYALI